MKSVRCYLDADAGALSTHFIAHQGTILGKSIRAPQGSLPETSQVNFVSSGQTGGKKGGGVAEKRLNPFFKKCVFQKPYRIIPGPPNHALHQSQWKNQWIDTLEVGEGEALNQERANSTPPKLLTGRKVKKKTIYALLAYMLQKKFTHFVRKVFARKSPES